MWSAAPTLMPPTTCVHCQLASEGARHSTLLRCMRLCCHGSKNFACADEPTLLALARGRMAGRHYTQPYRATKSMLCACWWGTAPAQRSPQRCDASQPVIHRRAYPSAQTAVQASMCLPRASLNVPLKQAGKTPVDIAKSDNMRAALRNTAAASQQPACAGD